MILIYNGVRLKVAKLHSLAQQPVMTADGADWVCDRVMLDVSAVYSPGATSYAAGKIATAGQLPAQTAAAIHHYLSEPRGALSYADEAGNVVVSSPPAGNTTDAMGGPRPLHVGVTEVVGQKLWRVRFAVETFLNDCPGGGSGSPLLSNRFGQDHEVDASMLTTVVTRGESWFQLDALEDAGTTADFYRNLVVPPVPAGFMREGIAVSVSPLGNRLTWQARDRELLPQMRIGDRWGVLTYRAGYQQQTVRSEGALAPSGRVTHVVTASVEGKPSTPRANLFAFALRMATAKLPLPDNPNPASDLFLTDVSVHESLHANQVEVRIVAHGPAAEAGNQGAGGLQTGYLFDRGLAFQYQAPFLDPNGLGPTLGSDNNTRTPTMQALAFAAALQAACSVPSPVKGPPGAGSGDPSSSTSPAYSASVSIDDGTSDLARSSTLWSRSNASGGVYTEYRLDARHETRLNKEQVPVAGPADDSGGGGPMRGHTDSNGNWVPDPGAPTSEVITLGLPYGSLVVDWTAERMGAPPEAPDPDLADSNAELLAVELTPAAVAVAPGGQAKVYRASGRYEYALLSPLMPGDPVPFPSTPNTSLKFGGDSLRDYKHDLIDGAPPDWSGSLIAPSA